MLITRKDRETFLVVSVGANLYLEKDLRKRPTMNTRPTAALYYKASFVRKEAGRHLLLYKTLLLCKTFMPVLS